MKKLIITAILFFSTIAYAQDKINYNEGQAFCYIFNNKHELLKEIPMGKNVTVEYDTFFKSYYIFLKVEDGMMRFDLKFINKLNDGLLSYVDKGTSEQNHYFLDDSLKTNGTLTIINQDKITKEGKEYFTTYVFKNLSKTPY